jgi:RNA polymerase sigma-70 factor (ECF subfamily)
MDEDDALIQRTLAGDNAAREELTRRHLPILARLVRRYVPAQDADDVAQRAMMRALGKLDTFRGESSFRSWAHRIAVNTALNHVRDEKRTRASEIDEADLITNTLGTQRLVAREAKERLLKFVADLPDKQRRSVELHLFRDLSFAEVAEELGGSEDSAKMNFHHAMKRLRGLLEGESIPK